MFIIGSYLSFKSRWPCCGQPTGENGATRAPIIIDLSREASLSSKAIILQIDSKSQQVSASKSPSINRMDLTNLLIMLPLCSTLGLL